MRTILAVLVVVALTACADDATVTSPDSAPGPAALAPAAANEGYAAGRILVRFRAGADENAIARAQGAAVARDLTLGIRIVTVPAGRELQIAGALSRNPRVEFAEPDWIRTFGIPCETGNCTAPTDTYFGYKWDHHNDGTINNSTGTELATTGAVDADIDWLEAFDQLGNFQGSATLGVLDTGILASHPDLTGRVVDQYDFHDGDANAADDDGHGTHVAAIATAHGNNGVGVTGVAYGPNIRLVIAKVCGPIKPPRFGQRYGCYDSSIAGGITWAVDHGANVLNLSLGGASGSATEQAALQYARAHDVLPVCAAGNESGPVSYPGAFPECVAVSATDWGDHLASYSNTGSQVELAAPGGDTENSSGYSYILSAYNDGGYAFIAGTSQATPQVAGLATLLHALGILDDDAKLTRMKSSADDLGAPGTDPSFGAGRINVYNAINGLGGGTPPPNAAPTASFTVSCADLACDFDGTGSSDSDGTIAAWAWVFGDGGTASGATPSHTYAGDGTYTVTLTVTDDDGATGSTSQDVTVSGPPPGGFTLSVVAYKVKGVQHADLTWSGATSANVDVRRDGAVVATTANDGAHTDVIGVRGGGVSYTYRVCEAGTATCSNAATAAF